MNFLFIILIFLFFFQIVIIDSGSNNLNLRNIRNNKSLKNGKKQKDEECDCQCKQQKVIAVEKVVEIPRVQILEENDDSTSKSFHDFKLYKLAKQGFNTIEQQEIDRKEIRKLLDKEGI